MPPEIRRITEQFLHNPVKVEVEQALVFTATKRSAAQLTTSLVMKGFTAGALHGDMHQNERTRTLNQMREGRMRVLVATDVAARGIDVPGINLVVNYDAPRMAEDYLHRIGRTGRAGRAGVAVTLPLFTSHRAGVLVEQTTLDQLNAQRQATLVTINGAVTAAAVTVQAQRQLYVRYRDEIIPQAQQVEQLAQESYQLGQTGIAALLQALQATRDARLRAIDAVSLFQNALADLERAIGAPLP